MSTHEAVTTSAAEQEAQALIATLHAAGQRLEELMGGEVDAVATRDGEPFLLRRAQEDLRLREAARHATILNALPARIALVDKQGVIISVNKTWEQFAQANGLSGPEFGVGVDYLAVCDKASQGGVAEGGLAADGIRSVLAGDSSNFSIQYACHSPTEQRWFLMTVTPLSDPAAAGAVIMHLNITAEYTAKDELRVSELRFRQMAESVGDVFTLRESGTRKLIYVNPAYELIWGRSCASLYAEPDSWLSAVHPDDLSSVVSHENRDASLPHVELVFRIVRRDGSMRWIEIRRFAVYDDAGSLVRVAAIAKDVTERKLAELGMKRLNRVYSVLSEINALIVRVRDRDELFREACRIAVRQGGFKFALLGTVDRTTMKLTPAAMSGQDEASVAAVEGILAQDDGQLTPMVVQAIAEKRFVVSNDSQNDSRIAFGHTHVQFGVHSMAILPMIIGGEVAAVLALYASEGQFFHAEEMRLLTGMSDNIALAIKHIDRREQLVSLASYDQLTGLANHQLFLERLAQFMQTSAEHCHRLALFKIDLERFKNFNDSLGQPAGDSLLQQVAERLTQHVGDVDRVARVGPDQFAVVLPEEENAGDVVRQLEAMIEALLGHPFRINGDIYRIAAKFGVSVYPDDGTDADTLFKNAEAALKKAKAGGQRHLFYTRKMTEAVAQRLSLENELRQALDNDEFVLHYQPKVSLATRQVTSVEALIRWNDPRRGLVPPGDFIPILEETGLIHEVGSWALRRSLADHLRWRAAGFHALRVAVNVSPLQLRHPGFIDAIGQLVSIDPRAADGLELEITEGMIVEDMDQAIASLQAIRSLGICIAIDDFGTGFSSLGYLSKLPIHTLKIDRMFTAGMAADSQGLALVSTIITLAHSVQLKVVAEGVETEEQFRLLRLLECDEMQGYLFSKPVTADVLEEKFLTRQLPG